MKYTKLIAKIYRIIFEYEHFDEINCVGCESMSCKNCPVRNLKEELSKRLIGEIKKEIKENE